MQPVQLLDVPVTPSDILGMVKVFEDSGISGLATWFADLDAEFQKDVVAATRLLDAPRTHEGRAWLRRLARRKTRS